MNEKEEIIDGLTVLRREGDLDRHAHWRSGTLTDGGIVDHHSVVDPHGSEGSRQGVSVCGGWVERGGERGEATQGGWRWRGRMMTEMAGKRGNNGY